MRKYSDCRYWTAGLLLLVLGVFLAWKGTPRALAGQVPVGNDRSSSTVDVFTPTLALPFAGIGEAACDPALRSPGRPFYCGDILTPPVIPGGRPAATAARSDGHKLAVYYAIPADITLDQQVLDRIITASLEIQAWYQVATGGVTWEFASPEIVQVYQAQEVRQYYLDHGNWWGSLLPEMGGAGLPAWSPGTVLVIWSHGAGWWAGGAQGCGGDCGIVLLGVELFPEFNHSVYSGGECPDPDGLGVEAWPCVPLGAFAHELGHTVGLMHPADDPDTQPVASHSIMQTHWNYPDEAPPAERPWGFLRNERQVLRANPFMKTGVDLVQIYQDAEIAVNLPASGTVPTADFAVTVNGNEAQFTNHSQGADDYYWTFGDYAGSNEANPVHIYARDGNYTVTLRASSDQSMMGVLTATVAIDLPLDNHRLYLPLVLVTTAD